ncbi:hypothetical protein HK16_03400 [Acetobacter senegalensis]|uniref:Transglycosylase SLT domain-containing protein n=2 Tax=Acetobacter TaxID=434 RepID=A0A252ELG3_9PROT|nr:MULTISPECIES: hypothetical protein [Acetobacter]ATJ92855.1 hypothetical protein CIW82_18590 [Acetobacter tropicalis]OUL67239.1 hypothetical protein HK16_03400 [Acetobacter senegalensis]
MLAGIGLRETNFQTENQIGGGGGRGVFQIDITKHPEVSEAQANDLNFAADWAANYLAQNKATIQQLNPNFTGQDLDHAVAASYNLGPNSFSGDPSKIDIGSTGNNYGGNVLGMMPAFKDPVTGLTPKAGSANGGKDGC